MPGPVRIGRRITKIPIKPRARIDAQSNAPPPPPPPPVEPLPPFDGGGGGGGALTVTVCSTCFVSRGSRPTQSRLYLNVPTVVVVMVFEPCGIGTSPVHMEPSAPPPDAVQLVPESTVQLSVNDSPVFGVKLLTDSVLDNGATTVMSTGGGSKLPNGYPNSPQRSSAFTVPI